MSTTAEQMRAWTGPALLTYGFRPFFFGAAVWATLAMALWVPLLSGHITLPIAFDAISWHAHEFLFGYVAAVAAGFLLTAVPNWTGRLPIVGWPLGGLFALWIVGRLAMLVSAYLPPLVVALADLAMPAALAAVIAREIIVGKNWRNLIVLGMLSVMALGNAVFHLEAARGDYAAEGYGLRIGLGATLMMIAVIGGRVVPSFTRNWLVRQGPGRLPVAPMQRFDRIALLVLLAALLMWVALPANGVTLALLGLAGVLHLLRLGRWAGERTLAEPLLWVLHLAYSLLPLGALLVALEGFWPGLMGAPAAQHLWMAGAVGLMTQAMMSRATLGHSGKALTAGRGTTAIYVALLVAVLARLTAGALPAQAWWLHSLAGTAWLASFGGFAVLYGPLWLRARARR